MVEPSYMSLPSSTHYRPPRHQSASERRSAVPRLIQCGWFPRSAKSMFSGSGSALLDGMRTFITKLVECPVVARVPRRSSVRQSKIEKQ